MLKWKKGELNFVDIPDIDIKVLNITREIRPLADIREERKEVEEFYKPEDEPIP